MKKMYRYDKQIVKNTVKGNIFCKLLKACFSNKRHTITIQTHPTQIVIVYS